MNKINQKGFSLIEVLIVIAIISILIAYAFPAYRDYIVRTKLTEGSAMAATYKAAVNEAYMITGSLIGLNNGVHGIAGLASPGTCVETIEVVDGDITVSFNCLAGSDGQAHPIVDASQVMWSSDLTPHNTVVWTCSSVVPNSDQDPCR